MKRARCGSSNRSWKAMFEAMTKEKEAARMGRERGGGAWCLARGASG